ncbi:MAG TPA: glycosyltransferase family 25 protein [Pyrinomonadaceae bacterium]|nr:glycosyltransferase family 25 protein [Pyrinomonadaceae bacterium]
MSAITKPTALIDQLFPHKVCINLDRRIERWRQMQDKFYQHGIHSVRRFAAIDGERSTIPANWPGTPGAYGCLLSHLEVVREARRLGLPSLLIFEDDVIFDHEFEQKFSEYVQQLPADWDMLFFGALHKDELIRVSKNIGRITQSNSTYACVLRDTVFDAFIDLNSRANEILDVNSLVLQKQFNCYCFLPHLAWVEVAYLDAQQKPVDHWYLRESLVLFGPQVDRLLSDTTIVFAYGRSDRAENLRALVEYYDYFFSPYLAMVIVEQGREPTLDRETWPANCDYVFLRDDTGFDPQRCFAAGIERADANRQYFILSSSDLYLETLDIRANLRMCERYDYVTGFNRIIDLSPESSARLRATKRTSGLEINVNGSNNNGHCRFLNRRAINTLDESNAEHHRVFHSPNFALRLF